MHVYRFQRPNHLCKKTGWRNLLSLHCSYTKTLMGKKCGWDLWCFVAIFSLSLFHSLIFPLILNDGHSTCNFLCDSKISVKLIRMEEVSNYVNRVSFWRISCLHECGFVRVFMSFFDCLTEFLADNFAHRGNLSLAGCCCCCVFFC